MHLESSVDTVKLLLSFFPEKSIPDQKPLKAALKQLTHHPSPNQAKTAADLLRLCVGFHEKRLTPGKRLYNGDDVFHHFYQRLQVMRQECLMLMLLDKKNRYLSDVLVSLGSIKYTVHRINELLTPILERGASGFVMVQHHLTGTGFPTELDDSIHGVTNSIVDYFDVKMLDHILINDECYYSYLAKARYVPLAVPCGDGLYLHNPQTH